MPKGVEQEQSTALVGFEEVMANSSVMPKGVEHENKTEQRSYSLEGVSVHIAIPVNRDFPPQTVISLLETERTLNSWGIPHELKMEVGGSIIERSRSFCCDNFLASPYTHMFWLDSDITWQANDFMKLLAFGTKMECVLGIYPIKADPVKWFMSAHGTSMMNEHGCLEIDGTGLGFCCIQRKVIQALAERAPKLKMFGRDHAVAHLFRCDSESGAFRGEDHAFFADVREIGYKVWLDPSINLGHVGSKEFKGNFPAEIKGMKIHA